MAYFGGKKREQLLIMNLWNDTLPWKTLMDFLECDTSDYWEYDYKSIGEHNVASPDQKDKMLPEDTSLDWSTFAFSKEYQSLFDLLGDFDGDVHLERNAQFYDTSKGFYNFWDKDNATHNSSAFDFV